MTLDPTSTIAHDHRRLRPLRPLARLVTVAVVAVIVMGACGNDGGSDTRATNTTAKAVTSDASESAYCQTARRWAVHELTPVDDHDASGLRSYMKEYVAFIDEATAQAPAEIAAQWKASGTGFKAMVLPVLEKYGYSVERIQSEGTDAEKAASDPPPDLAEAQAAINEYEGRVCDASQPEAADVEFAGSADRGYCEASATLNSLVNEAIANPDPNALKAVITGEDFSKMLAALAYEAPDEIRRDAVAVNTWDREKKIPLTASYGYDIRKLLLEGTAHERKILQSRLPEISDHYARVAAYEEQFCQVGGAGAGEG